MNADWSIRSKTYKVAFHDLVTPSISCDGSLVKQLRYLLNLLAGGGIKANLFKVKAGSAAMFGKSHLQIIINMQVILVF